MENIKCIFCTQMHENNWVETETQKGNTCDICYKMWQDENEKECNVCNYILPIEDFLTEWENGYDLPEEMCLDCAQNYQSEIHSKY